MKDNPFKHKNAVKIGDHIAVVFSGDKVVKPTKEEKQIMKMIATCGK